MKIASKELSAVSLVKAAFEKARQFAKYNVFVSLAEKLPLGKRLDRWLVYLML